MKWVLMPALAYVLTLSAACKKSQEPCEPLCLQPEPPSVGCVPDLFKRYDQVFSAHAEFLLWSVATGDLDYALKMRNDAWGPSPSFAQGKYETATYGLDPGFRLGLLFFRAPHYWEVRWQYTRMTSSGENHSNKPEPANQFLTGTWPQISDQPLAEAKSRIHLNYNVFDWLIDRVFFPNPHLRLRFVGGSLVTWMNQDWKVRYRDVVSNTTTTRNKWKYVGAGLKSGTIVDWYWTGDLYMTASGFFGVTMGSYSNHSRQTTTFQPTPDDNPAVPVRNASYSDVRPAAVIQILLGPSWQKNYTCTRIELFAGFELTSWFNLQEIFRSSSGAPADAKETWINSSMLSLYGLTTRLSIDF